MYQTKLAAFGLFALVALIFFGIAIMYRLMITEGQSVNIVHRSKRSVFLFADLHAQ